MSRTLESRDHTEFYCTESGMVAIKQEDPMGNDPSIVLFDANDIPQVVEWLEQLAADAKEIRAMKNRETLEEAADVRASGMTRS